MPRPPNYPDAFHLELYRRRNLTEGEIPRLVDVVTQIKPDYEDSGHKGDWSDYKSIQTTHGNWLKRENLTYGENAKHWINVHNGQDSAAAIKANGMGDLVTEAYAITKVKLQEIGVTKFAIKNGHPYSRQALVGKVKQILFNIHADNVDASTQDIVDEAQDEIDELFEQLAEEIGGKAAEAIEVEF